MKGRGRHALFVLAAAVALVAFAYLTPPTLFEGTDWLQLHLPNKVHTVEALSSGRLPLWNPYVALGRPFLADTETAVFYPPNLLYLLLDPSTTLLLLTLGHYVLGLLGMLALGRALGIAERWAWLAAAAFLWSGPLVARLSLGQVPYVHATCYVPVVFALAVRLQDAPSARRVAALAGTLALQLLCGHPQIAWVTWVGVGAFVLGRSLPPTPRSLRQATAGLGGLALGLAAALALAAPMLLPFFELVSQGNRSSPSVAFSSGGSLEWWQWTSLALPDGGRRVFSWEVNLYAGLLPLVVGMAGLTRLSDRNVRGLLATALAGAVVALGTRTPVFAVLYTVVPGLSSFHLHSRAGVLVVLSLVLGAGLALSQSASLRRTVLTVATGLGVSVAAVVAFRALTPVSAVGLEPFPIGRLALVAGAAVLAGLSIHLSTRKAPSATLAHVALAVLVLAELGASLGPVRRAWFIPTVTQGEKPLSEGLLRAGLYAESGVPPRVNLPPWAIRQNSGLIYKWSNVAGYNALTLDRVWVTLHQTLGLEPPRDENTYPSRRIYDVAPFPFGTMNLVAGWTVLPGQEGRGETTDVRWQPAPGRPVLRPPADPRAFLSPMVKRVADWQAAVDQVAKGHDVHGQPLVEDDTGLPEGETPGRATGRAKIVSFEPEHVVVETQADTPSLLVLSEAWYPGWSATVDGDTIPCLPANGWMRAVVVPAGRHRVELSFHSRWLWTGILVSLMTAAALLGLALRERRLRRSAGPEA